MSGTYVFLDTNIFLHAKPIHEVDWVGLVGEAELTLVTAGIVVDELDVQKDSARSGRIKDRARMALKMIESWDETGSRIRPGVAAVYLPAPARKAVTSYDLDPERGDDVLLASICAFRRDHAAARFVLVTGDTGPRIKARRLEIECLELPERYRVADADPLEIENRKLQAEIAALKSRAPVLSVRLHGGLDDGYRIEVVRRPNLTVSREEYVNRAGLAAIAHAPERNAPPRSETGAVARSPRKHFDLADLAFATSADTIPADEYERYAQEREEYIRKARLHAEDEWQRLDADNRSIALEFSLNNSGTAVAEDIDVSVHIPDGAVVAALKKPSHQDAPSPPKGPRTYAEKFRDASHLNSWRTSDFGRFSRNIDLRVPEPNVSAARIKRTHSYDVEYRVKRLKHLTQEILGKVAVEFPRVEEMASLKMEWSIRCASVPTLITGAVHLIIRS
jgi:hypothetical protein